MNGHLSSPVAVRINAASTEWYEADLAILSNRDIEAVLLPKGEDTEAIDRLRQSVSRSLSVVVLVETVRGIENVNAIAQAADRLAFGSLDFAADLGGVPERDVLLYARSRMVMASRLAGKPAPLDGITADFRNDENCRTDTAHAVKMGFGGRLCIHPAQLEIVRAGFRPSEADVHWAEEIVALGAGAVSFNGQMVDAPVKTRARQIIERWEKFKRTA